jgi:hypothetical protein
MSAELLHPLTGEVYATNLDSLVSALRDVDEQMRQLASFRSTLSALIAGQVEAPPDPLWQRTARLATENNTVKLVYPPPRFDQKTLRTVWENWPKLAPGYLSITGLRVRLREFKKLVQTTGGSKLFREFKCGLISARLNGSEPMPRVIIEDRPKGFAPDDLGFDDEADGADSTF